MPKSALPKDLIRDYWRGVRDRLVSHHNIPDKDADNVVRRVRKRMKRAGDTVYNTDPARLAQDVATAYQARQSDRPLAPSASELGLLPAWGKVAFAVRCLRRAQSLCLSGTHFTEELSRFVAETVQLAEDFAGQAGRSADKAKRALDVAMEAREFMDRAHSEPKARATKRRISSERSILSVVGATSCISCGQVQHAFRDRLQFLLGRPRA